MKRFLYVVLVSSLLVTLAFAQEGSIPVVKASSSIHQGDLVLSGNNVTTIEGRFDINGSIIVEDNATLILRNAVLNFEHVKHGQFEMTLRNPDNGNPCLLVENSTIDSNGYWMDIRLSENSSATVNELTTNVGVQFCSFYSTLISILDSTVYSVVTHSSSTFTGSNSSFTHISSYDSSMVTLSNCTIGSVQASDEVNMVIADCSITYVIKMKSGSANYSVVGHEPGFVSYWDFRENCSVVTKPGYSKVPEVRLENVQVESWGFISDGDSNVAVYNSELRFLTADENTTISVYDSTISENIYGLVSSHSYVYDTSLSFILYKSARIWLVNSTCAGYDIYDQAEAYVAWHLDVLVTDSIGQKVPSANVTATYPNGTVSESKLTNADGRVRLTLMEKMMNATGEHPIGNYTVRANYDIYSDETSVNMTENKQVTPTLEDFVIPEFPSFLILPLFMISTLLAVILYRRKHSM